MKQKQSDISARYLRTAPIVVFIVCALALATLTAFLIIGRINASTVSLAVDRPVQYSGGQYPFVPGTNRRYAIVTVHVTNHTASVMHFAPVIQTHLTDSNGERFDMAPSLAKNPIRAGEIAPGETRSGQLSYNVPNNTSDLKFHFAPTDTAKEIIVRL